MKIEKKYAVDAFVDCWKEKKKKQAFRLRLFKERKEDIRRRRIKK